MHLFVFLYNVRYISNETVKTHVFSYEENKAILGSESHFQVKVKVIFMELPM